MMFFQIFCFSAVLTFVHFLVHLDEPSEIDGNKLIQGQILHIFFTSSFWKQYPSMISPKWFGVLINIRALLLTVPFILGIYYFLRVKRKYSLLTVGLVSFPVGLIGWFIGISVLKGNIDPSTCGRWIATMVLGMLYSTLACGFFSGLYLFRSIRVVGYSTSGLSSRCDLISILMIMRYKHLHKKYSRRGSEKWITSLCYGIQNFSTSYNLRHLFIENINRIIFLPK